MSDDNVCYTPTHVEKMPVGYTDTEFTCENVSSDSLAPIIIMLLLVPFTRNAVLSMAIGIWIGWCIYERDAWFGTLNFVAVGIPEGISGYNQVLTFLWLFMGIVGIGLKSGGFDALAEVLVRFIKDSYTGQLVTYLFGFLIFFDDYSNTMIVGNIIVPVTDKMRVSREKLSFIVDCTAAPIASLFMISTWVAYELSLIDEALTLVKPPYTAVSSNLLFITSIGERYYAWFMLFFVFFMALSGRDWGPMYHAEVACKESGLSDDDDTLMDFYGIPQVKTKEGIKKGRWWNGAIVPVTFLAAVLPLMIYNGACAVSWGGIGLDASFSDAISNADPYTVLIWLALLLLCVMISMYFVQGVGTTFNWAKKGEKGAKFTGPFAPLLWPKEAIGAACEQVGLMWEVFVVLIFAKCIGNIVKALGMPKFIECGLGDMAPGAIPAVVFTLGALNSLGTGTSWGTMAVLFPAAIPLAITVARAQSGGVDDDSVREALTTTIAAVLGGAIFGDHCSIISDTTLLSAMACRVSGWNHFKTQFPYAVYCGVMSILLGYLPRGFGMPSGVGIFLGLTVVPLISYGMTFIPHVGGPIPIYKPAEGKVIGEGTRGIFIALRGYFKKPEEDGKPDDKQIPNVNQSPAEETRA